MRIGKIDWDAQEGNRSDNVVVGLLVLCTCLPPYMTAAPGIGMLIRIFMDKSLRRRMWAVPFFKALFVFCMILLISTFRFGNTLSVCVSIGMIWAMVAMVYLRVVVTPMMLSFLLRYVLWGAIASVVLAVVQAFRYDTAGGYRPDTWFFNPNSYSMICGFIFVSALYQWIKRTAPKPLLLSTMAACALGLILSNSRMGMASAIFGALMLVLWIKSKRGALCVLLGMVLIGAVLLTFPGILRLYDVGSSLGIRTELWQAALSGIAQKPIFGQGAWAFVRISSGILLRGEVHAHNMILEFLLSVGIVGTVLLALYVFGNMRDIYRLYRTKRDKGLTPLIFAIFCMALFHGMMDFVIVVPHNAVFLLLLLGIAGWVNKTDKSDTNAEPLK